MLADSLCSIIQEQYPFKHPIKMELLSAKMNDIYRVYSENYRYYLRIPRHERFWPYSLPNYQFEMDLANFLRKADISVSYPIPTSSKSFLGILNAPEGVRYFSLHTEASGTEPQTDNLKHMEMMGTYLAHLHLKTTGFTSKYTPMKWDFELLIDFGMNCRRIYQMI